MTHRRAILHLGTYKTGSSSIQNYLYSNRSELLTQGVLYPMNGLKNDDDIGHRHTKLLDKYINGHTDSYLIPALSQEIDKSGAHTLIVSSEAWSNPIHHPMLGGLREALIDKGYQSVIGLAYFRNIADYKTSHYREFTVRQGNRRPYGSYIRDRRSQFDYLHIARVFRSIFKENMVAVNYSEVTDAVVDFLKRSGLNQLDGLQDLPTRSNYRNMSAIDIEISRCANMIKLSRADTKEFRDHFRRQHENLFLETWTEEEDERADLPGSSYLRSLSEALGWNNDQTARLLQCTQHKGRPVSEVTPLIIDNLKAWRESLN